MPRTENSIVGSFDTDFENEIVQAGFDSVAPTSQSTNSVSTADNFSNMSIELLSNQGDIGCSMPLFYASTN